MLIINIVTGQETTSELAPKKIYQTKVVGSVAPTIDGVITDPAWETVDWGGDFIQRQPNDGSAPTAATAFKILYDQKFIYIAVRCYDDEPDKIEKRMGRRDGFEGDWIEINIDSYHDLRTAFSFTVSASGVKGDEAISNNGDNWDGSWNPIWYTETQVDELGWTAEMKIPLSQLRFGNQEEQVWGLQFNRLHFRYGERSNWQPISQNAGVWVSAFGELKGIKGIQPKKPIEIQPYVLAQAETYEKREGNPFGDGLDTKITAGIDGKIGITNDLLIDFTINPDFGQVDADPSAVNLNGFQIFFEEQRPFFIENRNIFEYQLTGSAAGGNFDNDQIFYSRRIGGRPHRRIHGRDSLFVSNPIATRILGATKFSGKTKKGLSIGIMEGITAEEEAILDDGGERSSEVVEPFTSYFVGRLQQDYNGGNTVVGGIFTATNRRLRNTGLDYLVKDAYTGGVDVVHKWDNQRWALTGKMMFSNLNGTTEAITKVQERFEHYFQRPDATHLSVDTSLTSFSGHGATAKISKFGGQWKFETGITYRSPELELNDLGFMGNADEINHFFWGGYRTAKPFSIFRSLGVNINHWSRWDFGGNHLHESVNANFFTQFNNFWSMNSGINHEILDINNNALFGGAALRRPTGTAHFFGFSSDSRKKFSASYNMTHVWSKNDNVRVNNYGFFFRYQPINVFNISISPSYNWFRRKSQYVDEIPFEGDRRYIVASIDQKTVSASIRFNYSVTPNLSFQYYGQPFISQVEYSDYKKIADPLGKTLEDRTDLFQPGQISFSEETEKFQVDENDDRAIDYEFDAPDFSFVQFRSNLVMRWEYVPGSELFLVWSQGVTSFGDPSLPVLTNLSDNLFGSQARNVFLLKYTYRFLR